MIPGVGFFYSGLARRKSALALIWLSMMSIAVVGFQWFFWGYSLAFSHTGSAFIGDLSNFGLMDVLAQPSVGSSKVPDILFCLFQGMFAAITYVEPGVPSKQTRDHRINNFYLTDLPLLSAPPPTVAECSPLSSSSSSGQQSSTIRLPTGRGMPTAGPSSSVASTLPAVRPSTFPPALPLSPTP